MMPAGRRRAILDAMPGFASTIEEQTGIPHGSLLDELKRLVADNQAHISRWQRRNGRPRPFYVAGPGVSEDKPTPLKKTELKARRDARRKAGVEKPGSSPRKPQPWFAALV